MLSDNNTAIAYAHVCEAIANWDSLLNILYDTFVDDDMEYVEAVSIQLERAKEVLEP